MFRLIYVSSAVTPFTQLQLVELLAQAREKNARLGITGMLLYRDGDFMQVLEGDKAAVKSLADTILADPRHTRAIVLAEEDIAAREFPDWTMGFRNLHDPALASLPGYTPFMNRPLRDTSFQNGSSECMPLLRLFRQAC